MYTGSLFIIYTYIPGYVFFSLSNFIMPVSFPYVCKCVMLARSDRFPFCTNFPSSIIAVIKKDNDNFYNSMDRRT